MLLFAGCAGFTSGGSTPADQTTQSNQTTTQSTTAATTTAPGSTTTESTNESNDTESGTGNAANASMQGSMTVLIGGSQVQLAGDDGPVTFRDGDRAWFTGQSDTTVAAALAAEDVELTAESLAYDGTTYDASADGTTVEVRVNGEPVDPTEYTLQDGDDVWVYVSTPETDIQPPGEYIKEAQPHQHGAIEVVVNGDALNLSKSKYQHQNDHFHLEGGDGDTWHGHTWSATYGWGLSTLGINVTGDSVTIDGTTYEDGENGTSVRVLVNGEPVEHPDEYRLKDGDSIRVVVTQSN